MKKQVRGSIKHWLRSSILHRLQASYFLLLFLLVIAVTVTSCWLTVDTMLDQKKEDQYRVLELVTDRIDYAFEKAGEVSSFVYLDDVQEALRQPVTTELEKAARDVRLSQRFGNWSAFLNVPLSIRGMYLVKDDQIQMQYQYDELPQMDYGAQAWYQEIEESNGRPVLLTPKVVGMVDRTDQRARKNFRFLMGRWIYSQKQVEPLGVLLLDLEIVDMDALLRSNSVEGDTRLLVLDEQENILYGADFQDQPEQLERVLRCSDGDLIYDHGQQLLINSYGSSAHSVQYIMVTDYGNLLHSVARIGALIVGIGLAILAISMLLSSRLANSITRPLLQLCDTMQHIRREKLTERIPVTEQDELGILQTSFNAMLDSIDNLVDKVYRTEILKKQASLNALQAQINPHFLYNTLDTINSMAILSDNEEIASMAVSLAELFRYAVRQDNPMVELRTELEELEHYFEIQRRRFGDRIRFEVDIPPELLSHQIMRLTLQPLVENAVVHGIEEKPEGGTVWISGCREMDGSIILQVRDNGSGVTPQRLAEVRQWLTSSDADENTGKIGLYNICSRLRLCFGSEASFQFDSEYGKGSCCTLKIPHAENQ